MVAFYVLHILSMWRSDHVFQWKFNFFSDIPSNFATRKFKVTKEVTRSLNCTVFTLSPQETPCKQTFNILAFDSNKILIMERLNYEGKFLSFCENQTLFEKIAYARIQVVNWNGDSGGFTDMKEVQDEYSKFFFCKQEYNLVSSAKFSPDGNASALIMHISVNNIHSLAVKRHKIVKKIIFLSSDRKIKSPTKTSPMSLTVRFNPREILKVESL